MTINVYLYIYSNGSIQIRLPKNGGIIMTENDKTRESNLPADLAKPARRALDGAG
jgi:hypothetical protein